MKRKITAAVVILAAAAVEAWRRGAFEWNDPTEAAGAAPIGVAEGIAGQIQDQVQTLMDTTDATTADRNIGAILAVIMQAEGTAGSPDPYRVCYAYAHTTADLSEHPAISGEWSGEPLSAEQCRGAGLQPPCLSTAAGAFQFTRATWRALKRRNNLPDFGPESQRIAALTLIADAGALADVKAGRLAVAIGKIRRIWASLPGAGYAGQGERSMAWVQKRFTDAGGTLA